MGVFRRPHDYRPALAAVAVLFPAGAVDSPPLQQQPAQQMVAAGYRVAWRPQASPVFYAQLFPAAADPDVFVAPKGQQLVRAAWRESFPLPVRLPSSPALLVPVDSPALDTGVALRSQVAGYRPPVMPPVRALPQVDMLDLFTVDAPVGQGDLQQQAGAAFRRSYQQPQGRPVAFSVFDVPVDSPALAYGAAAAARAAQRTAYPWPVRPPLSPAVFDVPLDTPPISAPPQLAQAIWRAPAYPVAPRPPYSPAYDGPYDSIPSSPAVVASAAAHWSGPWTMPQQARLSAALLDFLAAQTAVPPAPALPSAAYARAPQPRPAPVTFTAALLPDETVPPPGAAARMALLGYRDATRPQRHALFNPALFPPVVDDAPPRNIANHLALLAYRAPAWPIQAARKPLQIPEEGEAVTEVLPIIELSTPVYKTASLSTPVSTGVTLETPI